MRNIKTINFHRRAFFSVNAPDISNIHESQKASLSDQLIKVSKDDKYIGPISKIDAHTNSTDLPHRAFSIFLFDKQNRLLLQQRANTKITFPNYWTNTCCSHPLHVEAEMNEKNDFGIKKAAKKRLFFEMGIQLFSLNALFPVNKIYYRSKYDETWGENEVDYVFFVKNKSNLKEIKFNPNEVKDIHWVKRDEIKSFLETKEKMGEKTTPWLSLMLNNNLLEWWENFEKMRLKGDFDQVLDLSS